MCKKKSLKFVLFFSVSTGITSNFAYPDNRRLFCMMPAVEDLIKLYFQLDFAIRKYLLF